MERESVGANAQASRRRKVLSIDEMEDEENVFPPHLASTETNGESNAPSKPPPVSKFNPPASTTTNGIKPQAILVTDDDHADVTPSESPTPNASSLPRRKIPKKVVPTASRSGTTTTTTTTTSTSSKATKPASSGKAIASLSKPEPLSQKTSVASKTQSSNVPSSSSQRNLRKTRAAPISDDDFVVGDDASEPNVQETEDDDFQLDVTAAKPKPAKKPSGKRIAADSDEDYVDSSSHFVRRSNRQRPTQVTYREPESDQEEQADDEDTEPSAPKPDTAKHTTASSSSKSRQRAKPEPKSRKSENSTKKSKSKSRSRRMSDEETSSDESEAEEDDDDDDEEEEEEEDQSEVEEDEEEQQGGNKKSRKRIEKGADDVYIPVHPGRYVESVIASRIRQQKGTPAPEPIAITPGIAAAPHTHIHRVHRREEIGIGHMHRKTPEDIQVVHFPTGEQIIVPKEWRPLEFLVKWRHKGYYHASWESAATIIALNAQPGRQAILRLLKKEAQGLITIDGDGMYYNPQFCEIDRIVSQCIVDRTPRADPDESDSSTDSESEDPALMDALRLTPSPPPPLPNNTSIAAIDASVGTVTAALAAAPPVITASLPVPKKPQKRKFGEKLYYLVKWKGLQYADSSWESASVVRTLGGGLADVSQNADSADKQTAVQRFLTANALPPLSERAPSNKSRVGDRPRNFTHFTPETLPVFKNENQLRPYQMEGLNWLAFNWHQSRNSILADEMGLGKTVQTVALFNYFVNQQHIRGPFLIIAPLSTIPHWQREFEAWTDLNVVVFHGNLASRDIIRAYEWNSFEGKHTDISHLYRFHVLITTFEMILAEASFLRKVHWKSMVVDEAHRLKNKSSRMFNELFNFTFDHTVLLTGTPIQNNLIELWTLLHFLDPEHFASLEEFQTKFGSVGDQSQVKQIHEVLQPYLLRRMKDDVEKSLPPREETLIEVELTVLQKRYYKAIYEKNTEFLIRESGPFSTKGKPDVPSLMNIAMQLRKCCNHPFLLDGVEDTQTRPDMGVEQIMDTLVQGSGKLVLLDKLLPKLKSQGHKVLIFSQMVRILDILEDYLRYRKYRYERLDGGIRGDLRQASIDRFSQKDSDRFVFLLCTRAGGVGINLTAADTVIIFDSDWNPQNDIQAQARCHRIGQTKNVKVYRLVTRGTYEMEMFQRASIKLGLDKAILHSMTKKASDSAPSKNSSVDAKEIENLLKLGAYHMFLDEQADKKSAEFCAEDIDQILERSSRVVRYDNAATGTSSFAKASFVSSTGDTEIDINDPDFWKKIGLKQQQVDIDYANRVRVRKQVERYDAGAADVDDVQESDEETEADSEEDAEPLIKRKMKTKRQLREEEREEREREQAAEVGADGIKEKDRYGYWSREEREWFERGLLLFGYGRWHEVQRYMEEQRLKRLSVSDTASKEPSPTTTSSADSILARHNIDDLRKYGCAFVLQCCKAAHSRDGIPQVTVQTVISSMQIDAKILENVFTAAHPEELSNGAGASSALLDASVLPGSSSEKVESFSAPQVLPQEAEGQQGASSAAVPSPAPSPSPAAMDTTATPGAAAPSAIAAPGADAAGSAGQLAFLKWLIDPSLRSPAFLKALLRRARGILVLLDRTWAINQAMELLIYPNQVPASILVPIDVILEKVQQQTLGDVLIPHSRSKAAIPAEWWGAQQDKDLVLGTYLCGAEQYTAMLRHPFLQFSRTFNTLVEERQKAKSVAAVSTDAATIPALEKVPEASPAVPSAATSEPSASTATQAKMEGVKADGDVGEHAVADRPPHDSDSKDSSMNNRPVAQRYDNDQIWPSVTALNKRLRSLSAALSQYVKKKRIQLARAAKRTELIAKVKSLQDSEPVAKVDYDSLTIPPESTTISGRKVNFDQFWNKKEKSAVCRTLIMFGTPFWKGKCNTTGQLVTTPSEQPTTAAASASSEETAAPQVPEVSTSATSSSATSEPYYSVCNVTDNANETAAWRQFRYRGGDALTKKPLGFLRKYTFEVIEHCRFIMKSALTPATARPEVASTEGKEIAAPPDTPMGPPMQPMPPSTPVQSSPEGLKAEPSESQQTPTPTPVGGASTQTPKVEDEGRDPYAKQYGALSKVYAKKILERVELFEKIHRLFSLPVEVFRHRLERIPIKGWTRMPGWWRSRHHDEELMRGVLRYGLGNYPSIFTDRDYTLGPDCIAAYDAEAAALGVTGDASSALPKDRVLDDRIALILRLLELPEKPPKPAQAASKSAKSRSRKRKPESESGDGPHAGPRMKTEDAGHVSTDEDVPIMSLARKPSVTHESSEEQEEENMPLSSLPTGSPVDGSSPSAAETKSAKKRIRKPSKPNRSTARDQSDNPAASKKQKTAKKKSGGRRRNRMIQEVERESDGTPKMPIKPINGCTVVSLGTVEWQRPDYHNFSYIWPVGYKSQRLHSSMIDFKERVIYENEIMDGGPNHKGPLFKVTATDDPEHPIIEDSATSAWSRVFRNQFLKRREAIEKLEKNGPTTDETVKIEAPGAGADTTSPPAVQEGETKEATGATDATESIPAETPTEQKTGTEPKKEEIKVPKFSVSGPEMFGFAIPTIAKLIQELPNAHLCQQYKMRKFHDKAGESTESESEPEDSDHNRAKKKSKVIVSAPPTKGKKRPAPRRGPDSDATASADDSDDASLHSESAAEVEDSGFEAPPRRLPKPTVKRRKKAPSSKHNSGPKRSTSKPKPKGNVKRKRPSEATGSKASNGVSRSPLKKKKKKQPPKDRVVVEIHSENGSLDEEASSRNNPQMQDALNLEQQKLAHEQLELQQRQQLLSMYGSPMLATGYHLPGGVSYMAVPMSVIPGMPLMNYADLATQMSMQGMNPQQMASQLTALSSYDPQQLAAAQAALHTQFQQQIQQAAALHQQIQEQQAHVLMASASAPTDVPTSGPATTQTASGAEESNLTTISNASAPMPSPIPGTSADS